MSQEKTLPARVGTAYHFELQVFRPGVVWFARYRNTEEGVSLFATPCTAETESEARALLYARVEKQGFLD